MFQDILPPSAGAAASNGTGVKASVAKRGEGATRLNLNIDMAVFEAVGVKAPEKAKFRVQIGDGENAGFVRVIPEKDGPFSVRKFPRGTGYSLKLGVHDWLPKESVPPKWCGWKAVSSNSIIQIELPSWARAKRLPDSQRPSLRTVQNGGDVTAPLMGDPAPGRSALAQKRGKI